MKRIFPRRQSRRGRMKHRERQKAVSRIIRAEKRQERVYR